MQLLLGVATCKVLLHTQHKAELLTTTDLKADATAPRKMVATCRALIHMQNIPDYLLQQT